RVRRADPVVDQERTQVVEIRQVLGLLQGCVMAVHEILRQRVVGNREIVMSKKHLTPCVGCVTLKFLNASYSKGASPMRLRRWLAVLGVLPLCVHAADDGGLLAPGPNPALAEKLQLYGQFVGDWDLSVTTISPEGVTNNYKGEWNFRWVLEG